MKGGDVTKAPLITLILRELAYLVESAIQNEPAAGVIWFITTEQGDSPVGQITVPDDHAPLTATVSWVDSEGSPATPATTPTWTSSDESAATVDSVSEDGNTATISIGSPGATVIQVDTTQEDGDVISATGTITVEPGEVVLGEVNFEESAPEPTP
jgi:hypothetical protein